MRIHDESVSLFTNLNPNSYELKISGMGGGGESSSVIQYTDPQQAMLAGQVSSTAAQAAGEMASRSIGQAISVINNQYNRAAKQIQPYTQEGVQALNQLNQYLQLDPYNPGKAPEAPVAPTLSDYKNMVSTSERNAYINQNTYFPDQSPGPGNWWHNQVYQGPGAHDTNVGGEAEKFHPNDDLGSLRDFYNDPNIINAVDDTLANDQLKNPYSALNVQYKMDKQNYDSDLENWNYANDQYNKYAAEGKFTTQQINDKISNLPGYQAQLGQGIDAIQKSASSQGYLGSGRVLKELNQFGQNTLSTFYGNTLSQLASLAGMGQSSAQSLSGATQNQGNSIGQQFNNLGTNQANSALASGNALSQAIIAAGQRFDTMQTGSSGGSGIGSILSGVGSLAGAFL